MIDRFTITSSSSDIAKKFKVDIPDQYKPSYNLGPTQTAMIIVNGKSATVSPAIWGLMANLSNNRNLSPKLFNLPADQALDRAANRQAVKSRRCILIVDGFYLWKQITKKKKTPYYFYQEDKSPFAVAGTWEETDEFDELGLKSFRVLTQQAQGLLANYQEDAPIILQQDVLESWTGSEIDDQIMESLLRQPYQMALNVHPVSPLINNLQLNHAELILPATPSDQHGNYTLFS
ncbi:MAG: SOS response-associated peptidase [Cyclobacteriaceae bacterium]|nr:SOS response-associated peptidase [Cyclobacteriaceae bacterium HetDA_MAG_MS6]